MRLESHDDDLWSRSKNHLGRFLQTPLGQSLPELHLIAFLYGGRFLEFGRRLSGLGYVSATEHTTMKLC
jgi:peroxin-10